ncbi:MAG: TetR/AcrR family transcriptional regulator [Hyphomonadaceae bacterium]|nr:TetR/AcrR family transcriptional regulator [Hyphomonadaceae bacterium]
MATKTASRSRQVAKKPVARRKNLCAADREKVILETAIRFFAEHGFEGQTRELAKRIGITHSAIYRHFPSKEALIERVYEHVYLGRWQDHWAALIKDRSRPLEARLAQFYREYAACIFDYDWVRIFVYSGLKSFGITGRYLAIVSEKIIVPAVIEARKELNLPSPARVPVTQRETELFWGLHGRIFYIAIRKFVYAMPVPEKLDDIIEDATREFMAGAPHVLRRIATAK